MLFLGKHASEQELAQPANGFLRSVARKGIITEFY